MLAIGAEPGVGSWLSPEAARPVVLPLRTDADADAEALRCVEDAPFPSDEPVRCSGFGFRGGVGFIGWLGTRPLWKSYPRNAVYAPETGRYRNAPLSIQEATARS